MTINAITSVHASTPDLASELHPRAQRVGTQAESGRDATATSSEFAQFLTDLTRGLDAETGGARTAQVRAQASTATSVESSTDGPAPAQAAHLLRRATEIGR